MNEAVLGFPPFLHKTDLVNLISELCTRVNTYNFTSEVSYLRPTYHPPQPGMVLTDTVVPGYMSVIIPKEATPTYKIPFYYDLKFMIFTYYSIIHNIKFKYRL
jgi:hypothetical protein